MKGLRHLVWAIRRWLRLEGEGAPLALEDGTVVGWFAADGTFTPRRHFRVETALSDQQLYQAYREERGARQVEKASG